MQAMSLSQHVHGLMIRMLVTFMACGDARTVTVAVSQSCIANIIRIFLNDNPDTFRFLEMAATRFQLHELIVVGDSVSNPTSL